MHFRGEFLSTLFYHLQSRLSFVEISIGIQDWAAFAIPTSTHPQKNSPPNLIKNLLGRVTNSHDLSFFSIKDGDGFECSILH